MEDNKTQLSDEQISLALSDEGVRERFVYGSEEICNEIIARYLYEISSTPMVPTVRGYSALSPVPRPKSLADAKRIVDGG